MNKIILHQQENVYGIMKNHFVEIYNVKIYYIQMNMNVNKNYIIVHQMVKNV